MDALPLRGGRRTVFTENLPAGFQGQSGPKGLGTLKILDFRPYPDKASNGIGE
jgi:hypothetical protein